MIIKRVERAGKSFDQAFVYLNLTKKRGCLRLRQPLFSNCVKLKLATFKHPAPVQLFLSQ
jgi:hypothetical protein